MQLFFYCAFLLEVAIQQLKCFKDAEKSFGLKEKKLCQKFIHVHFVDECLQSLYILSSNATLMYFQGS